MAQWKFFLLFFLTGSSLTSLAQSLEAAVFAFNSPEQPYAEILLQIYPQAAQFAPLEGQDRWLQAKGQATLVFSKAGQMVKADKFDLYSPISEYPIAFRDLKRYQFAPGSYELIWIWQDLQRPSRLPDTLQLQFTVPDFTAAEVLFSDIALLNGFAPDSSDNRFVKNGYRLDGIINNTFLSGKGHISFYTELYGSDGELTSDYLLGMSITAADGQVIRRQYKRRPPKAVDVLLLQMPLDQIAPGHYTFTLTAMDAGKRVFADKSIPLEIKPAEPVNFTAGLNGEDLKFHLRALVPVSDGALTARIDSALRAKDTLIQQQLLREIWLQRAPDHPQAAFLAYGKVAESVHNTFRSGFRYGFETDRGYMYLKYGRPNDIITVEDEMSAPPYEIWSYHQMPQTGQNNVRFLFYNPSLAPGDYQLLHSNVIGERNNPSWERDLYRDAPSQIQGSDYFGGTEMQDNFHRNARRYFREN